MRRYFVAFIELVLGFHKTLYINLRFFGFRGFYFPILVSKNTIFRSLKGDIHLDEFRCGVIRIGFSNVEVFDAKTSPCVFKNTGKIHFKGKAFIGQGVSFESSGSMEVGNDFRVTANSIVLCKNKMRFGSNVLISWNVQVADSDFHSIIYEGEAHREIVGQILIGDRVWICSGVTINKNVEIGDDVVVASGAVCTSGEYGSFSLIAGFPARTVKKINGWKY